MDTQQIVIGILPCGGHATRMNGIPKMILPAPNGETLIDVLANRMNRAGPRRLYIGARTERSSLLSEIVQTPALFYQADTATMTETVLKARRYVLNDEPVLLGLPDTYFEDGDAFRKLMTAIHNDADVAVGLFKTRPGQHKKLGMCMVEKGRVAWVVDKPQETTLFYAWGVLAWKPAFWDCLDATMPHVGYGLSVAIERGLNVAAVLMDGQYHDCGDSLEYFEMIRHYTGKKPK